jgi:cytochrome c oxidase cbb3-type subunit III
MGVDDPRKRRAWLFGPHTVILILLSATPAFAGDPKRGEPMFQRYCSGCHGVDGRGGGKNFMPHVGALTRKGYTELLEDDYFARIITDGGEAYGKSAYMPAFKTALSPQDIADVIAYVRTFPLY